MLPEVILYSSPDASRATGLASVPHPPAARSGGGLECFGRIAGRARQRLLAFFLVLPALLPAQATDLEIAVRHGDDGSHTEGNGVALRFGPWWSKDLGGWNVTLRPELELNHFHYRDTSTGPSSLNEAGAIGLFRIDRGPGRFGPYAEFGLGGALLSNDRLGKKQLSTHFQFSEHLGLGLAFTGGWFAGWRFSHYSNAGMKSPNDGIDQHQLVVGIRF